MGEHADEGPETIATHAGQLISELSKGLRSHAAR
jgi:hypothetical protein